MASTVQPKPKNTATTTGRTRAAANGSRRKPAAGAQAVTHDAIAARAHELYVRSGFQAGREVEFWLEAERQLRQEL